eukprot:m.175483 g.175483  ORF g.175483 m.175483 type:complete len:74 (+) comp16548_c2_seq1:121-342(+)
MNEPMRNILLRASANDNHFEQVNHVHTPIKYTTEENVKDTSSPARNVTSPFLYEQTPSNPRHFAKNTTKQFVQ